eukprot:6200839-Pleurochrysis_carterae.AAC.1
MSVWQVRLADAARDGRMGEGRGATLEEHEQCKHAWQARIDTMSRQSKDESTEKLAASGGSDGIFSDLVKLALLVFEQLRGRAKKGVSSMTLQATTTNLCVSLSRQARVRRTGGQEARGKRVADRHGPSAMSESHLRKRLCRQAISFVGQGGVTIRMAFRRRLCRPAQTQKAHT